MQVKGTYATQARHGRQDFDNDIEMQSACEDLRSSDQSALLSESEREADPGAIRTSPASNNKMTGIRLTQTHNRIRKHHTNTAHGYLIRVPHTQDTISGLNRCRGPCTSRCYASAFA